MSTTIALAVFLPCAPVAMLICYWRGRRLEERKRAEAFATDVEIWLSIRGQGRG